MRRDGLSKTIFVFVLIMPVMLMAQAAQNAKESIINEKQIAISKMQLERDQLEVREFKTLLETMDAIELPQGMFDYKVVNAKLLFAMRREQEQANQKASQSHREVRQSRREARKERQEALATENVRDRIQATDDQRDLRDDRRDRKSTVRRAKKMGAIIDQATNLLLALGREDAEAISKNRELMGEFLQLLYEDLEATKRELGEDRRERREDRRERRTDRRQ
jgi:hypothetical protein